MPGPVSQSHAGQGDRTPYVPSWCYPAGPKVCPCGHHEGFHNDAGECLLAHECGCTNLPPSCFTSDTDFAATRCPDHLAGSGSRPVATPLPVSSKPATVTAGALPHEPETRGE